MVLSPLDGSPTTLQFSRPPVSLFVDDSGPAFVRQSPHPKPLLRLEPRVPNGAFRSQTAGSVSGSTLPGRGVVHVFFRPRVIFTRRGLVARIAIMSALVPQDYDGGGLVDVAVPPPVERGRGSSRDQFAVGFGGLQRLSPCRATTTATASPTSRCIARFRRADGSCAISSRCSSATRAASSGACRLQRRRQDRISRYYRPIDRGSGSCGSLCSRCQFERQRRRSRCPAIATATASTTDSAIYRAVDGTREFVRSLSSVSFGGSTCVPMVRIGRASSSTLYRERSERPLPLASLAVCPARSCVAAR